ncbi:MAG: ABC transporter permease [Candidatus Dojkabacteria bacterium]
MMKSKFSRNLNSLFVIAYRDILKFLNDRARIAATFIFPGVFIGILGYSFQSNLGAEVPFNFLTFVFVGVLAQTLFQSAASGIISLIEDRENDFSQEIFISPVSRYTIILGKILGESMVALLQAFTIIVFAYIIRVPFAFEDILVLIPFMVIATLFGASFGVAVLSMLNSQRSANQVFPFLVLPQFFLSGIFTPITELPATLAILARVAPLTYIVDLFHGVVYAGEPQEVYDLLVLHPPWVNILVIIALFIVFLVMGTWIFIRKETNK